MANIYGFSGGMSNRIPGGAYGDMDARFDIFQRLLSPEEWMDLPAGERASFQNYMDYVQQQQRQQRQSQRMSPRTSQGGVMQFAGSGGAGTTTRFGESGGTGGIPKYRTVTDIRGNVSFNPVGGKRDIGGDYIPKALEDVQDVESLRYAIPKMQAKAEADLYTELNRAAQLKASERNPKALMEQQKLQQGNISLGLSERRVNIAEQEQKNKQERFYSAQSFRQAMLNLISDLRIKAIETVAKLRDASKLLDNNQQMQIKNAMGLLVGTDKYDEKQQDAVNKAKEILAVRYAQTDKENDKKRIQDIQDQLITAEKIAVMKNIDEPEYKARRDAIARGELDKFGERVRQITRETSSEGESGEEVERLVDGKTAIFDVKTKKFIRWK